MPQSSVPTLKHWGNNLGVRLPAAVANAAHLHVDQRVRVLVEEGRMVIEPLADAPLTLAQRLALFDPVVYGGEAMADPSFGGGGLVTRPGPAQRPAARLGRRSANKSSG